MKNNSRIRRAQRREAAIERASLHVHNARETGVCIDSNKRPIHKKDRKR